MSIIYVRSDYWGRMGVNDLLSQERECLTYADELRSKVTKVLREKPSYKGSRGQMAALLMRLEKNSEQVDYLIMQSPRTLAKYKEDYFALLKKIRGYGIKVMFVIYKNNSKEHEKN